jgi:hypothetical protein
LTVIEAVCCDLDCKMSIISLEILNWEFKISCGSLHAIQYLQEGVCILPQDYSRDNGNFLALVCADQLVIPALKEGRFFV